MADRMAHTDKTVEAGLQWHVVEYTHRGRAEYLEPLLAPLEIAEHSRFLDLGCGGGYVNGFLAAHNRLRCNIGLDLFPETVALARELNSGARPILWICGSAEAIPLPDDSMDVVVCRGVVPLATVEKVVAETARILRPGGRAVFLLHSWSFYLRWLSLDPRKWKRSLAGLLHFFLGIWFNLTGQQLRVRLGERRLGQTFQTVARMRRVLAKRRLRLYRVKGDPEFLVYFEKLPEADSRV
jgi:SAM-dependent methyltransferase